MKTRKTILLGLLSVIIVGTAVFAGDIEVKINGATDAFTIDKSDGSEGMRVTADGKVGIGTDAPQQKLHIKNGVLRIDAPSAGSTQFQLFGANGTQNVLLGNRSGDDSFMRLMDDTGTVQVELNTQNSANYFAKGNFGIGTSAPTTKLDIRGGYAESDRVYYVDYVAPTNAPKPLLDRNGDPVPPNFTAKIFCAITNTNAPAASEWMVRRRSDGVVYAERIASFGSTSSNTPEIFNNGGVLSIRQYNHNASYTTRCKVETLW